MRAPTPLSANATPQQPKDFYRQLACNGYHYSGYWKALHHFYKPALPPKTGGYSISATEDDCQDGNAVELMALDLSR
jgi:hypothetical protein